MTIKKKSAKPAKKAAPKKTAAPAKKKKAVKKKATSSSAALSVQDYIAKALDGDKAIDIVSLDLKGKSSIADHMVIATGTSSRHVSAMAQKLRDRLSSEYKIKARIEGKDTGDWVVVDAGDVIVHLFRAEVREFYNLEKLWGADFSTIHYTRYQ